MVETPMPVDDEAYYQRRAEEEVERARASEDPRIVRFHYALSELYLDRIHDRQPGDS